MENKDTVLYIYMWLLRWYNTFKVNVAKMDVNLAFPLIILTVITFNCGELHDSTI